MKPVGNLIGHRNWAPDRKIDPGLYLVDLIRDWKPPADGSSGSEEFVVTPADKQWFRDLTGAGGGVTVVGQIQGLFNKVNENDGAIVNAIKDLRGDIQELTAAIKSAAQAQTK